MRLSQLYASFPSFSSMFRRYAWALSQAQRRCMSTSQVPVGELQAQKPKAKTSLRRTAAESLPIRSNKTATRSEIQSVLTFATAERYLLSRLRGHLPPGSRVLHESWWIPRWSPKDKDSAEGEVFVFGNGSFVSWGLAEKDAEQFVSQVIARSPEAQVGPLKEPETEELEFVTDPIEFSESCILRDIFLILSPSGILDCKET